MLIKKTFFVIAIAFLAIAIAAPTIIFLYNNSLNNSNIIVSNPNSRTTSGNVTAAQGVNPPKGINNTVPVVVAIVFFALSAIFFYIGLRTRTLNTIVQKTS